MIRANLRKGLKNMMRGFAKKVSELVKRGQIILKGFDFPRIAEKISRIWRRSDFIGFQFSACFSQKIEFNYYDFL